MTRQHRERLANRLFAFGHHRRIAVLMLLINRPDVGDTLGTLERTSRISHTSLIHHLRVLERAGFVDRIQKGGETEYRANRPALENVSTEFIGMIASNAPAAPMQKAA